MSASKHLIFLKPIFYQKIWGGRALERFGFDLPAGPIGECWAISAHEAGDCTVSEGPYKGETLSSLWRNHRELFGMHKTEVFPLLIKILDAQDDLSLQVHPDDAYAAQHCEGALGKSECWYVLDAKPEARIVVGQHAQNKEDFKKKADEKKWDELVNTLPTQRGDFFQINPGTIHAIKAGTLILEIQQSSDITYRVWDYDRLQDDGTLRELHLKESLEVIDFATPAPTEAKHPTLTEGRVVLEQNSHYKVELIESQDSFELEAPKTFWCVSIIGGEGQVDGHTLRAGSNFVVPASYGPLTFMGNLSFVLSSAKTTK